MSAIYVSSYCLLLKNQECSVKKVIVDNDYMTFPHKIKVDKCVGSCNDVENSYFKVCLPDSIKNISVKSFDLITRQSVLKNISFQQSCKCGCLLDEKVCNNLQRWNVSNCRCEMKKLAALIEEEECDVETSEKIKCAVIKKATLVKKNRKL